MPAINWISRRVGGMAAGMHEFGHRNLGLVAAGAIGLGLFKAHPLRELGHAYNEGMYGDPNAHLTVTKARLRMAGTSAITGGNAAYNQALMSGWGSYGGTGGPPPTVMGSGPDGSMVFGLYNDRIK